MVGRAVVIYYAASWPRLGRLVDGSWQAWLIPGSTWCATSAPVRMVTHAVIPPIRQAPAVISMASEKPDLMHIEVANRGHAPLLNEPQCLAAIDAFAAQHGQSGPHES